MTLVETLVAAAAGAALTWSVLGLWSGARRIGDATAQTVALHDALLLEEALLEDLRQLGVDADADLPLDVAADRLSFHRVSFAGPRVQLRPVRYTTERTADGYLRLTRTEFGPRGTPAVRKVWSAVPLASLAFELVGDPELGNRYVCVRMRLAAPGAPHMPGLRDLGRALDHAVLVRVNLPAALADPRLADTLAVERLGTFPDAVPASAAP